MSSARILDSNIYQTEAAVNEINGFKKPHLWHGKNKGDGHGSTEVNETFSSVSVDFSVE